MQPHENIVKLLEVLYDEPTGRLALVFELMEKNLYELISSLIVIIMFNSLSKEKSIKLLKTEILYVSSFKGNRTYASKWNFSS